MSSDADYASFLDKANQDTGGATAAQTKKSYGTTSVNTKIPTALEGIEEYYVSDADEPFEPVALEFDGKDVDEGKLKELLDYYGEVSSLSEKEFDPKRQYKAVIDAVKKAGNGEVKVFRVHHSSTRGEYYVVSVDEKEGRVVGLKALGVES